MSEVYDVAIIGAGVTGTATARALSRYQLKIALLEKEADAAFGVSKANSGIIHGGFHYPTDTLKGRLEIQGNLMFEKLQYELGFPFSRCGIIVIAFSEEELAKAQQLYRQGLANGVPNLEWCSPARMYELEPKLYKGVLGGLFAPGGGVVEPYRYVYALLESAQRNGVDFLPSYSLTAAERKGELWHLTAADGRMIKAGCVVNAAGLFADDVSSLFGAEKFVIRPRKGEEYLLDRRSKAYPSKVIFPIPSAHSKGVLIIPTVEGTTMIGPTSEAVEDKIDRSTSNGNKQKIFTMARKMVGGIDEKDLITSFSGSRPVLDNEDFFIELSAQVPGLIQAAGIQSPGLTASPAIGEYICGLYKKSGRTLIEKNHIVASLPRSIAIRQVSAETADELHRQNPQWTNIICRCEKISEAEIVHAIRQGHTSVDGIKFYTRAGMGRCQGGFCSYQILKIIARETGLPMEKITRNGKNGFIIEKRLGEEL